MTEENRQHLADDPDATVVRPFFTEEAAEAARPVEPLTQTAAAVAARHEEVAPDAPRAFRPRSRRNWPVALVLVSALAGAVLGGITLRFFQTRSRADAQLPAARQTPASDAAQADTSQPVVDSQAAPAEQQTPAEQPTAPEAAPQTDEPEVQTDETPSEARPPAREEDDDDDDAPPATARRQPTAEARPAASAERADEGARKRGKRGAGEDERAESRPRRPTPSPEGSRVSQREPLLVDVLQGEPERRRQRRRGRAREPRRDSVRAIFEGQPPR